MNILAPTAKQKHEPVIISSEEYNKWVTDWKSAEYSGIKADIFKRQSKAKNSILTGVLFNFDTLRFLFSTTGLATVKIRFGLDLGAPEAAAPQFRLILFGADNANEVITPYYSHAKYVYGDEPDNSIGTGNLPQALMKCWEAAWYEQLKQDSVSSAMFKIHYGFLQGYNYSLKEVMDAMCTFKQASDIQIRFGLHEYYDMDYTSPPDQQPTSTYTLGLILYASYTPEQKKALGLTQANSLATAGAAPDSKEADDDAVEDSGYYDLTAPCPRTC